MAFFEIAGGFADENGEAEGEDEVRSSSKDSDEVRHFLFINRLIPNNV